MIIGERAKNAHERKNPQHTCQQLTPSFISNSEDSGVVRQSEDGALTSWQIWEEFVKEIQGIPDCPLKPLVTELVQAIDRWGGMRRPGLQNGDEHLWVEAQPYTVPSQECWVNPVTDDDAFGDDLWDNYKKKSIHIYRSGQAQSPVLHSSVFKVLDCYYRPDPCETYFATNIPSKSHLMRMPSSYTGPELYANPIPVTTNLTPKFCAVDPHIDWGRRVLTLMQRGGVKLWALFPGPPNFGVYNQIEQDDDVFIKCLQQLRGGKFIIPEKEALCLPPGCIHGTITLRSGLTTGVEFSSAECIEAASSVFDMNLQKNGKMPAGDYRALLESCTMGFRSMQSDTRRLADTTFCKRFSLLQKGTNQNYFFEEALVAAKEVDTICLACTNPWKLHGRRREGRRRR